MGHVVGRGSVQGSIPGQENDLQVEVIPQRTGNTALRSFSVFHRCSIG